MSDHAKLASGVGSRLGFAATDAVTALCYLWTWVAPGTVYFADRTTMELVYVVEFGSLHAAGFLAAFIVSERMSKAVRILGIVAVGAFYVGIAATLGMNFGIWWPAGVMAVFVGSKIAHVIRRRNDPDAHFHFGVQWGGATTLFVLLSGLAFALPWPHLGIPPDPGEGQIGADGARQAAAHTLIVAGFLYFSVSAALKYRFASYFLGRNS